MTLRFRWNVLVLLFCLLGCSLPAAAGAEGNALHQFLQKKKPLASLMPSWLDVQLEHRTRYETFDQSFKKDQAGSDQQIHQRTRLQVRIKDILEPIEIVGEFADFRTPVSDRGQGSSPIFVDHLDVFQLHADLVTDNLLGIGQSSRLEVGRLVLDFGKGRLVAGHRFGSFTPSFDGIQWWYGKPDIWQFRVFGTRPVQRHSVSPDSSTPVTYFWGGNMLTHQLKPFSIEPYYFGLHERGRLQKRRLSTFGLRLFKESGQGTWDFEIETIYQFGEKLGTSFLAHRHHGEIGWTFDIPWQPRAVYLFDYSSGDRNPNKNFDFLFAKRRAEYGPTGIFGIIFPSNILSPAGFRVSMHPLSTVQVMLLDRSFWLADSHGPFVGSGLQDPTGRAGRYLGNLLDLAVSWTPAFPALRHITLDAGFAHFFKGDYFDRVPSSPSQKDVNYVYSMVTVRL